MNEHLRLVIVEDDALIAMDLSELLVGMGHDVCAIASTEGDAEAAAANCHPDLMIVDGSLRDGSGVAAMLRILKKGDIAHFYITGNPWAVRELTPDAIILAKPFNLRDLQSGIVRACAAAGQRLDPA
jgi:DNA-binding NtrC family response regulator